MSQYSTVTKMVEALLTGEVNYSNQQIVDLVRIQFPDAKTTTKSVSSVASTMRRFGLSVAKRTHEPPNEKIAELELLNEELVAKIMRLECEIQSLEQYAGIEVQAA